MNQISLFPGLCMFFACAFVGMWIKRRMMLKAEFYEDYYQYLLYVTEKIGFERMPIAEIKSSFLSGKKTVFKEFLSGERVSLPLSEGKTQEISHYLSSIGTTDVDTQMMTLKAKCAELKRYNDEECSKFRKDGSLYFKLGVLKL